VAICLQGAGGEMGSSGVVTLLRQQAELSVFPACTEHRHGWAQVGTVSQASQLGTLDLSHWMCKQMWHAA
jgi:hypothetical protein